MSETKIKLNESADSPTVQDDSNDITIVNIADYLSPKDLQTIESLEPSGISDYFKELEGLSDRVKQ